MQLFTDKIHPKCPYVPTEPKDGQHTRAKCLWCERNWDREELNRIRLQINNRSVPASEAKHIPSMPNPLPPLPEKCGGCGDTTFYLFLEKWWCNKCNLDGT